MIMMVMMMMKIIVMIMMVIIVIVMMVIIMIVMMMTMTMYWDCVMVKFILVHQCRTHDVFFPNSDLFSLRIYS